MTVVGYNESGLRHEGPRGGHHRVCRGRLHGRGRAGGDDVRLGVANSTMCASVPSPASAVDLASSFLVLN